VKGKDIAAFDHDAAIHNDFSASDELGLVRHFIAGFKIIRSTDFYFAI